MQANLLKTCTNVSHQARHRDAAVSIKVMAFAVCAVLLGSYAASFLLVCWLTHDVRRFMLPALQYACLLIVLLARRLFLARARETRPRLLFRLAETRKSDAA
jgi:uncharacterized membrane protein YfcA